ncbi:Uncharacterised protein [Klebsiella michiganensis]|uniref:Uncharacterized protein n=2 Tax=Klebsiella michiganensis TaxID=1134687 RepID=A0A7H4M0A5_9ENTR|nr:Uncharacterised protein [Klebsiella michiganensis]
MRKHELAAITRTRVVTYYVINDRHKKTRFRGFFYKATTSRRLSQFVDLSGQVCFMTRSFVFVDQTFSSLTVHDWLHFVKCFQCSSFVASFNSCVYFLDESTHHRATASVVLAGLFRLNGALLS